MVRAEIKTLIDSNVPDRMTTDEFLQHIETPYPLNADELVYLQTRQDTYRDVSHYRDLRFDGESVTDANPLPVTIGGVVLEVNLDWNNDSVQSNMNVGELPVDVANPVPISEPVGGMEVIQDTHDDLNANVNIQVGDVDVDAANKVPVESDTAADFLNTELNSGDIKTAVELIDDAIITDETAASDKSIQVAGTYHTTLPELTDGDSAAVAIDKFTRWISSAFDASQGVNQVIDPTTVSGVPFRPDAWTQLTAVGVTAGVNIDGFKNFGVTVVIASITGDWVDIRIEASRDGGTTYVNANENQGPTGYTRLTANGNYDFPAQNRSYTNVRLRLVDEDNAAVTVDGHIRASN